MDILLTSSGEWFKVFGVIFSLFAGIFILLYIYSKITEHTKIDKDTAGCGWPIFLLVIALIIGGLINMKSCSCKGSQDGEYDPDAEYWEHTPRHTDKIH